MRLSIALIESTIYECKISSKCKGSDVVYYNLGTWGLYYKTFYGRYLRIFCDKLEFLYLQVFPA